MKDDTETRLLQQSKYWRWRQTTEKNNLIFFNNIRTMTNCRVKSNLFSPHDLIVTFHLRNNANKNTDGQWLLLLSTEKKTTKNDTMYETSHTQREICQIYVCFHTHYTLRSVGIEIIIKAMKYDRLTEHMDGHCSQWSRWTKVWTKHTICLISSHPQLFHKERLWLYYYILKAMGFWWIVQSRNPA